MPRVDTTDVRRQKRDVQQRMSHLGRSSPLALYSPSTPTPPRSASAIVKLEPATTPIPSSSTASLKITIPAPVPATPASPRTWRHPAELPYIRARGKTWDDLAILAFLTAHAFSVPPRGASTADPWVHIICADGQVTVLPRGYRIPLLWVAKFQWTSLALVLSAHETIRKREWNNTKFEILHIARLCAGLLEGARAEMVGGGMDRGWRCAMFDRALRRYWHDWMIMRDEFVRDFWREFDEEEYEGDVLKLGWGQWVLKGHKGFTLTKQEVLNGITAQEFMEGLVVNQENSTFEWVEPDTPPPEVNMEVQPEMPETHTTPMPTAEQTPAPLDPLPQVTVPESPTAEAPVPMSVDEQDQPPPMTPLQESTQPASPAHDLTPPPPQSEHAQDPTPPPPQPEQAPAAQVQPEIRPPVPPPNSSVTDDAPNGPPKLQRIPLPGERRRSMGSLGNSALGVASQAQVHRAPPPPMQSSSASNDPAPSSTGVEMAVDQPVAELTVLQTPQLVESMVKTPETTVAPLRKTPEAYYPSPVTPRPAGSSEGTGVELQAEGGKSDDAAAVGKMKVEDKQNGKALGCTWFRGHPTDVFKTLLEEDHDQSRSGYEGRRMAVDVDVDEELAFERYEVGPFRFNGTVERDGMDADMGEDMQLLYPDQVPSPSTDRPPSSTRSRSPFERHPSESSSSSSSSSLRLPSASASSSALFMPVTHDHAAPLPSYQRSPRRPLLAPADFSTADPGILTLFAQSCNILGDEIRALRAEVGMLRGELGVGAPTASPLQLEHRVRLLEQQSPQRAPPRPQSPWTHPLQHLIAGEDERMDVDKNGETLPIRSHRKQFRNTMRF